jgi:hypothetical protein
MLKKDDVTWYDGLTVHRICARLWFFGYSLNHLGSHIQRLSRGGYHISCASFQGL